MKTIPTRVKTYSSCRMSRMCPTVLPAVACIIGVNLHNSKYLLHNPFPVSTSCILFIQTCNKSWFKMMLYVFRDVRISVRMADQIRPINFSCCFSYFWCSAVTSVDFSSNLSNFEKIPKIPKQIPQKIPKKNPQKNPK